MNLMILKPGNHALNVKSNNISANRIAINMKSF